MLESNLRFPSASIVKGISSNKVSLEKAKKAVSLEDVVYHMNKQLALEFLKKNNGPVKAAKKEAVEEAPKKAPAKKATAEKKAPAKKVAPKKTTKKAE